MRVLGILTSVLSVIAVATAVLLVNGGYVYKKTCPNSGGGADTSWTYGIDDILPYIRKTTPPCVSHTGTRLLISWVGISPLGSSGENSSQADKAFVDETSAILRDLSVEWARQVDQANTLSNYSGDKATAALTVLGRASQAFAAFRDRLEATTTPDDPDLVALRTNLTRWVADQHSLDEQMIAAGKSGTLRKVLKEIPNGQTAREIIRLHTTLNDLALTLQAKYPELDQWSFLQTSG